jgi:hypothetical protein
MAPNKESSSGEIMSDLIRGAIPLNPSPGGSYVTHDEFLATVRTIEQKIENASLRTKQWVMGGCLAVILSFGGGYMSLVNKIDRLTEALPEIAKVQEERGPWIQRQEQRDAMQDEVLRKLDKSYQPLPYSVPPQ